MVGRLSDALRKLPLARRTRARGGQQAPATAEIGSARPPSRRADPLVAAVLTAITQRALSPDEQQWVDRIEDRREALKSSSQILEYVDYGAGAPTSAPRSASMEVTGHPAKQSVGNLTKVASKDRMWAALLLRLVRHVAPERCVEMGAAVGISAAYQAAALALNGHGKLTTLEGGEALAEVTEETLQLLGLGRTTRVVHGRFADTLPGVLAEGKPDYVFLDGHHDGEATKKYFSQVDAVMDRGVVVLDDIDWSDGMRAAWDAVRQTPSVAASVDLGRVGICVIAESRAPIHCALEYTAS